MPTFYRVDFTMANNEDLRQAFQIKDDAGVPVDITGADLRMDIEAASGADAIEATIANGRIALADAAAGQFEIAIPAATMRTLTPGYYRHDLVMTLGGEIRRVFEGGLDLARGVTE